MSATEIVHPAPWGSLAGTLLRPDGDAEGTAVLLISGSGPTDRDGNTPLLPARIDNVKRLAEALADRGIASLRYDKRGLGGSTCPGLREEGLRFEQLVEDAAVLAGRLAQEPGIRRVVLAGHSEGALIAALAAPQAPAQAVVSISGAGSRASALMRKQIEGQLPPPLAASAAAALAALEQQQPVTDVPDDLLLLFRSSVQPYLISWFRHDPPAVLAQLALPVLVLHGSADAQVEVEHARWLQQARPDARLAIVEGMDHLLSIDGDIAAGVQSIASEMAAWLQELDVRVAA